MASVLKCEGEWRFSDMKEERSLANLDNKAKEQNISSRDAKSDRIIALSHEEMLNFPIKLTMWDFGQCDVKKCTGRKLERLNCLKTLKLTQASQGIILRYNLPLY